MKEETKKNRNYTMMYEHEDGYTKTHVTINGTHLCFIHLFAVEMFQNEFDELIKKYSVK